MKNMKRLCSLLLVLTLVLGLLPAVYASPVETAPVTINAENFPDEIFRNYVSNNFDTNEDGILSSQELDAVTKIDVGYYRTITSLKGVEHFKNLSHLECWSNQLSELDVSKNPALEYLRCGGNQLSELDLRGNPKLEYLDCMSNQLKKLDVSGNPNLETLRCTVNQLTSLDVSGNPKLEALYCSYNQLACLDVNGNPLLELVWYHNNSSNVTVPASGKLALDKLPGGFDPAKASDWVGGTVKGNILTVNPGVETVTYLYAISEKDVSGLTESHENERFELRITWDATACPSSSFKDVPAPGHWAHEGIDFVVECGLFNGTSNTTFAPNSNMTRAMLVTVLWRAEGEPAPKGSNSFKDVKNGNWYTDAITWAAENGIVKGIGDGKFDPNGNVTREQIATILYRFLEGESSGKGNPAKLNQFPDGNKVSQYAKEAMAWAVEAGLIQGSAEGGKIVLQPKGNATRAQVATILMRLFQE